MGYGIALNADHVPWNLIPWDIFKNNQNNNGTVNSNQPNNLAAIPQKSTSNTSANPGTTKTSNLNTQNSSSPPSNSNNANSPSSDQGTGGISSDEAKSIADGYIKEPGASSGTPKKVDIGGNDAYVVPVESNGSTVGEIHIDPETGENVGGAGGAP